MTTIGAHGNAVPTHEAPSDTTHETGQHASQHASHQANQHGNGHQHAAKLQSAKVHAAQVAKTKLTKLHAQQRASSARRAQIVAFYRNHKFATVAAGRAASVAAQKMIRQFGERPRPSAPGKAVSHKRGHAGGESQETGHGTEREAAHTSHPAHAGEHAHPPAHPNHPPHRHREGGQHRDGKDHEQEQGRHSEKENDDAAEQGHQHRHGRGSDDDQSREEEHKRDQEEGQQRGHQQEQQQNRQQQPHRDEKEHRRAGGVAGFAKAARRGVLSASGMASAARASAPNALQGWACAHRGAVDLADQLAARYAKTLVGVAPKLEFGAAMAPLMLLSLLSPMSATRDPARFSARLTAQRAASIASAPPEKSSVTSVLLGHAQDANEARQQSGLSFTDAQQTLTAVKQWLMDATSGSQPAASTAFNAAPLTSAAHARDVQTSALAGIANASHITSDVRVSAPGSNRKP